MTLYSTLLCGRDQQYRDQSEAFSAIVDHYLRDNDLVLDATYNKGVFWKRVRDDLRVIRSDKYPQLALDLRSDYAALPFRSDVFDAVVIDPPYGNSSTTTKIEKLARQYNLSSVKTPKNIYDSYFDSMWEARRVLSLGGILIVKCQNFISSGTQYWIEHDIYDMAKLMGYEAVDKFLMITVHNLPVMRHEHQLHARKWGSTFWIFRKKKLAS